jgi:signal transduction histidine kinase
MPAPRILVVEDERIVALHLRQQLINLGYEVPVTVASGDLALREVEASPPDLVLMDINLEGAMDGIATAARIPRAWHIPVIYLTAYSEEATLARASATNPYGYLLKPFSERELHAMIQVTLARCRAERAADAAEQCRRQTEKMRALGQLAAGVADDFNELLTVIYGQLEELGQQATLHPTLTEPIQQTFEEAIRKERLIRQLLAFSGRQKLTPVAASVNALVANAINQIRPMLAATIQIDTHLPADLWTARIDANQFAKALTNIAMNARDAMPDGGRLTITAQNIELDEDQNSSAAAMTSGDYILLTLSDTGEGMPEHVLHRAFEPFFTTKPTGDGLGLSLVFGFIRQSGGHISIDSKQGGGTTVRLWLPAAPGQLPAFASAPPVDPGVSPAARERLATVRRRPTVAPDRPELNSADERRAAAANPSYANGEFHVPWLKADNGLFAAVATAAGDVRYRLVVEPLPRRNGWDWTVWRPGGAAQPPRHGRATSVVIAMAAAEAAARLWAATEAADGER